MKHCDQCGKDHSDEHPHIIKSLSDQGFPTHDPSYHKAHIQANIAEQKRFGKKSFHELEKLDRKFGKHELAGKNLPSGKIEVSKKVPKKYREEVEYHEKIENKNLRR